jgi:hypothetical protein
MFEERDVCPGRVKKLQQQWEIKKEEVSCGKKQPHISVPTYTYRPPGEFVQLEFKSQR